MNQNNLHPKDLSAALSHPDQHCPFLARESRTSDEYENVNLQSFLEGMFRYPVSDDWAPNFPGEKVTVFFRPIIGKCGHETWRIGIWGMDDIMRGKSFSSKEEAQRVIRSFPPFLSRNWLHFRGFHDNGHTCLICKPEEKYPFRYLYGV